jgi:hypothetical protein
MEIHEFVAKYYFHDSFIKGIENDIEHSLVKIIVHLCNWLQDSYTSEQPEILVLQIVFKNVSAFQFEHVESKFSDEIVDVMVTELSEGRCRLEFILNQPNNTRLLRFETSCVEVEVISSYNH